MPTCLLSSSIRRPMTTWCVLYALALATTPIVEVSGGPTVTVEPRMRVDSGGTSDAAETSVVAEGLEVVVTWNDLRSSDGTWKIGVATSNDGGRTWQDGLLRPSQPQSGNEWDPMTARDPRTGRLWAGGLATYDQSLFAARLVPGTSTFEAPVAIGDDVGDKGWMAAGRRAGQPNATRLFVAYQNAGVRFSDDRGQTWSPRIETADGLGPLPRVGPDGELYIGLWDSSAGAAVVQRSLDGGVTLEPARTVASRVANIELLSGAPVPGRFRIAPFTLIAVSPVDGTLYAVFADVVASLGTNLDVDLKLFRSDDRGVTWAALGTPHGVGGDQFHPWVEVGDRERVHLAYFDTRNTAQDDTDANAWIDVYYAWSDDRGQSWTETRVTDAPFAGGSILWDGSGQFLGDYIGLAPTIEGAIVAYPATFNGDLDIFTQRIVFADDLFTDGFESGDTSAWSGVVSLANR